MSTKLPIKPERYYTNRFRGFLPIVIDVETGGFNPTTDGLLEVAAVSLQVADDGTLQPDQSFHYHLQPFPGANLDPEALAFTGIDPYHPFRLAVEEKQALTELFSKVAELVKQHHCQRAVLVGHNPAFDRAFLLAATERCQIKDDPFHRFTTFDTATLSALALQQTVLAKALRAAKLSYDPQQAHGALYDADRTAALFCHIINHWQSLLK